MQMCDFNKGEVTLLHGCPPVKTAYVKLFSVKIVKLEQGIVCSKLTIKTPERQN